MNLLTGVYLFYILFSMYITFIILLIYFRNKKEFYSDELEEYTPFLTVLIPAFNEEKTIANTIRAVQNSNYPKNKLEIIVVDDGSTDDTPNIVKKFKSVILFSKKNTGKADSVNKAIKLSKGKFIAIVDADSYPEKDSLLLLMKHFKDEKVGATTGMILVRNKKNLIEKCQALEYILIAWTRRLLDFIDSVFVTPGGLSIYRKSALKQVGYFDKKIMTEDIEIAWNLLRHKYKIKMETLAYSFTSVPSTIGKWWRQRIRWDVGGFQTLNKHKKHLFKTEYEMFGIFIIPLFLFHLILSFAGFFVFLGVLLHRIYNWILFNFFLINTNSNLIDLSRIYILPNVFTSFAILLIFLFGFSIIISLRTIKKANIKIDMSFFVYTLFYLSTFPILLIVSMYKWFRGYSTW
jgi:peptidoglycan-N-acetylglucosamine deacetylase